LSPERYEIKKRLQDIAYKEFRNPNNKTAKSFIDALKRQGVTVEPVRNKQNKIYGIRFQFEGQTFKASEIGKEFGLRSLFLHYRQNIDGSTAKTKHFEKPQISPQHKQNQSTAGIIGGLLDLPLPTSDYDADEEELQQQTRRKKKKRRGGGEGVMQYFITSVRQCFDKSVRH